MKTNPSKQTQSGSSLVVAVLAVFLLAGFVAVAVDYTNSIGRNAQRDRVFNTAVEIGDGYISEAFAAWRQTCKNTSGQNPPTSTFASIPSPSPGDFPSYPTHTVANYKVQAVDPIISLSNDNPPTSTLAASESPSYATGPGSGTFSYFYLATVDVTLPAVSKVGGKDLTAKVRRIFEKRYTSPWNWAMMYNGDLELHPDGNLTLDGWVHTNGNVYVGNGDATATPPPTLTLTDRLTYQGNYAVGFDPSDTAHSGQTNVATPTYPSDLPPGREQYYSMFDWDISKFNTGDANPNNDGYQEMIQQSTNTGTYTDPFAGQRLYDQAFVAITIDASNNVKIYTGTGASKTDVTGQTNNGSGGTAAQAGAASISPNHLVQDNREGGQVRIVDFDLATWLSWYPSNTTKSWNGIVYITDLSGSSSTKRAIRIKNGAKLPSGGMTIVSNNPVYVQGDFNSGKTSTVQPPSNTGDPTDPDASGYTRVPASIMADAITLLSNNWNDANASAAVTSRVASNTTVNAALLTGNVPTGTNGSIYSGGGENFVRFMEDWTSKTFTYYGSMLNLFASSQGIGNWGSGNVYLPPTQKWFFDSKLSVDSNGDPVTVPGYVSTVAYLQQQRWYLQY